MIKDESFEAGLRVRREMFGKPGADDQIFTTTELNDKLQEIVTRYIFGDFWERGELSRRERSLITVAMMLALGKEVELGIHMRGALANGVTDVELREIALHSTMYCGIAAAAEGIRVLGHLLAEVAPDSALLKPAERS